VAVDLAHLASIFVVGQEGLGTEESSWKALMNEDLIYKRNDISTVVQGFLSCSSHVFHLQAPSYAIKIHRRVELSNGQGIHIGESVCAGMSTSCVDNGAE